MASPLPSLRRKKQIYYCKKAKTKRGMATPILTVLPEGDGEMATSMLLILL